MSEGSDNVSQGNYVALPEWYRDYAHALPYTDRPHVFNSRSNITRYRNADGSAFVLDVEALNASYSTLLVPWTVRRLPSPWSSLRHAMPNATIPFVPMALVAVASWCYFDTQHGEMELLHLGDSSLGHVLWTLVGEASRTPDELHANVDALISLRMLGAGYREFLAFLSARR